MPTIYVRLDPRELANPDADVRYALPDRIQEMSCGEVNADGYDYVAEVPYLLLFMQADDVERGLRWVLDVLEHDAVLATTFFRRRWSPWNATGKSWSCTRQITKAISPCEDLALVVGPVRGKPPSF